MPLGGLFNVELFNTVETLRVSPRNHIRSDPFRVLLENGLRLGRPGLSRKELNRVEVMGRVKAGSLRLREAAELLELSYRQTKRLGALSRGRREGAAAQELRTSLERGVHGDLSWAGVGAGEGALCRLRPDTGCRALGQR